MSANSGRYFDTGSVIRKCPSSKRIMTAAPVTTLLCE